MQKSASRCDDLRKEANWDGASGAEGRRQVRRGIREAARAVRKAEGEIADGKCAEA